MLGVLAAYPLHLLGMLVLLGGSAFFSGSETALFNLSRDQLRRFRASGGPFRLLAARLMDDPRRLLVTVLFGNMTVNTAFFAMSVVLVLAIGRTHPAQIRTWRWIIMGLAPLVVIVFGEVAPKSLAATMPERLAPLASGPLVLLEYLVAPVRIVLDPLLVKPLERLITGRRLGSRTLVTTDELQSIVEVMEKEGAVSRDESEMLTEVLELADLRVREVMTPRVEVVGVDRTTPMSEVLALFRRARHSKLLVYDGAIDEVRGVVYAKTAFLSPNRTLDQILRPVHYVPEMKSVESLLREFRSRTIQFAVVVDEYGGVAGLVTLEDCLEEIVGEIEDEDDVPSPEPVQRLGPSDYVLDGRLSVRSWADLFDQDMPEGRGRYSTVAGFVTSLLGHVPSRGDTVRWRNVALTVETVRRRRITRVRLRLLDEARPDAGGRGGKGSEEGGG